MTEKLTINQAVAGFILNCNARHLSHKTITMYEWILRKFATHCHDLPLQDITLAHIETFLADQPISNTSLHHYHAAISSLYTWATTRTPPLAAAHLGRQMRAPKPDEHTINPFTAEEVRSLLKFSGKTRAYHRTGKRASDHSLNTGLRNHTLILLLLDTGMRASELAGAAIADVDMKQQRLNITGKGRKTRTVKFSPRTGETLWKYLASRPDARAGDALIATLRGSALDNNQIYQILHRIGARAGVSDVHPHRFRHTFATEFLRNGGDPYTLQELLGHSSMDMVRKYVHLAQIDIDNAHRRASPVDNWRL